MWEGDDAFLGPVMAALRREGMVSENACGPQSSRFAVSSDEWEDAIRPALAASLGVETSQVRLERAIEMNVIPQMYTEMSRKDDLAPKRGFSWIWLEEYFAVRANRLVGGQFYFGAFSYVFWPDALRSYGSYGPLVVL